MNQQQRIEQARQRNTQNRNKQPGYDPFNFEVLLPDEWEVETLHTYGDPDEEFIINNKRGAYVKGL